MWSEIEEYRLGRHAFRIRQRVWCGAKARKATKSPWYVIRWRHVLYASIAWPSGWPRSWAYLDLRESCATSAQDRLREVMTMALSRRTPAAEPGSGAGPAGDAKFTKAYPLLWEHLTATKFADGSPRKTSSLSIFVQDSDVKCIVRDREAKECLFATADGVFALFEVVEALLADPHADWRRDRFQDEQAGKVNGKASRRSR